jgi:hypothetical protein
MPSSIDTFIPKPDVDERYEKIVRAPAHVAFEIAERFDLQSIPLVQLMFRTRTRVVGARTRISLARTGSSPICKMVGRPRTPSRPRVRHGRNLAKESRVSVHRAPTFWRFDEPGFVKIAWTIEADSVDVGRSRMRTQTRVVATDAASRRLLLQYWRVLKVGIGLVRRLALTEIRRQAERRYRGAGV